MARGQDRVRRQGWWTEAPAWAWVGILAMIVSNVVMTIMAANKGIL